MNLILYTIIILWSLVVLRNILFWTYLWQVKDYRKDRFRAHFELPSSKKLLLGKRNAWLVLMLGASIAPVAILNTIAMFAAFVFYGFFAGRSIQQFQDKALVIPKKTIRALGIVFVVVLACAALAVSAFTLRPGAFLALLLAVDLLLPFLVSLGVAITLPVVLARKKLVIKRAASKIRKNEELLVLGVAGSYGKSSVAEILSVLLSRDFKVLKTPQGMNTETGIARTILKKLNKEHEIFIVEIAAYKTGEIKKISEIINPDMGILTGLNSRHATLFGSMQNIQKAHFELIRSLPDKGLGVFNADNNYTREMARKYTGPKRIYTTDPMVDKKNQSIVVEDVKSTKTGLELKVKDKREGDVILKTTLSGRHNASNIAGAITVARELGVDYKTIKSALADLKPLPHRFSIKKGIKETTFIDDSYPASVDGVIAALDNLSSMKGRRKIFIFQPIVELGDEAVNVHKKIGAHMVKTCDIFIITGRDYFTPLYKEALDNGANKDSIFCIPNPKEALRKAQELTDEGDIILVENTVPEYVLEGLIL